MDDEEIMYDTRRIAEEFGISEDDYMDIRNEIRAEFPNDDMMFELHLFRALKAHHKKGIVK